VRNRKNEPSHFYPRELEKLLPQSEQRAAEKTEMLDSLDDKKE
jgi:hypothetical protein